MVALTAMRGAALIVEGGDHAVILQLELLIERELRQRRCWITEKVPRMAQAAATVSEIARISRAAIDRSLNMGRRISAKTGISERPRNSLRIGNEGG